jgi:hypothetical protein
MPDGGGDLHEDRRMSAEPPTLAQQIEAVEWALALAAADHIRRALEAALETLKHLEFMREAL